MRKATPWLPAALVLGGMACLGVGLAVVGALVKAPLCFGGGSECKGVTPIWEMGGRVLLVVGGVIFYSAPFVAGLVAWRMHARSPHDDTSTGPSM